ncbi:MAG: hypothetical protein ACOCRK_02265 [bacterium]
MPIYSYKNPKTNKVFDKIRSINDRDKPIILDDGTKCHRVFSPNYQIGIIDNNAEVFEKDPDYVKKMNPKYVKFKDGHKEKYDPTKHR